MLQQLNQQAPMPTDRSADSVVIHSYFHTIQGEGPFAGRAAFFVRLAGCNLQCPHCDTIYIDGMVGRQPDYDILSHIRYHASLDEVIVITGGEPFRQEITPLVRELLESGYEVQIETNGVLYPGDDFPWQWAHVIVSPKTGRIHPKTAARATAYKYVLSHEDVADDGLPIHALGHSLGNFPHVARPPDGWTGSIYLNPMDAQDDTTNEANVQAVVDSVLHHKRYTMGVQMHKMIGLP